ncbi:hypothetical protein ACJMK2_007283 [Sinanodonta woodiana]|uniref:Large ribosomal subunit protein uL29m n=1 Tax=Sinanodonta woodiana TaxID=1069815 RepID=A0ABD3VL86_SINWO
MNLLKHVFCRLQNFNSINSINNGIKRINQVFFSTSQSRNGLMEFFDDKLNWGMDKVSVGRPWRVDELRIKSNEDLHKLWYVLLKERNMLMTMEEEYKRKLRAFPSPERIFKVEESMENLQQVVKERNEAYNVLETGTTGEHHPRYVKNFLGLTVLKQPREHIIPEYMNKKYKLLYPNRIEKWQVKYLRLHREKMLFRYRYQKYQLRKKRLRELKDAFPYLADEVLEEHVPEPKPVEF